MEGAKPDAPSGEVDDVGLGHALGVTLLQDIIDGASGDEVSVATLLRKVKVVARGGAGADSLRGQLIRVLGRCRRLAPNSRRTTMAHVAQLSASWGSNPKGGHS